jgi:hypothetical protein
MGEGDPKGERVATGHPGARQGEIDAGIPGQARQKKSRAYIGEKANAYFRHGEGEMLPAMTCEPCREIPAPPPMTIPSAQGIEFDAVIKEYSWRQNAKLFGMAPSLAEIIQDPEPPAQKALPPPVMMTRVTPGSRSHRSSAPAISRTIFMRVECLGAIKRDEAAAARFLAIDFRFAHKASEGSGPAGK